MPVCATRGMTTPCKRTQTGSRKTANQKAKDGITKSEMYSNKTAKHAFCRPTTINRHSKRMKTGSKRRKADLSED